MKLRSLNMKMNMIMELMVMSMIIIQVPKILCSKCMPGSSCWPDENAWQQLNKTIQGQLVMPRPPAQPCYSLNQNNHDNSSMLVDACSLAHYNWTNAFWRADQVGAMQYSNQETTRGVDYSTCPLTASATCRQGDIAAYAVVATQVSHIQAALRFASEHNLRVSVKSTGHDILGRSTAAGSLNIWTHRLLQPVDATGIVFHNGTFVPESCNITDTDPMSPVFAVTIAAGMQWGPVYDALDKLGVVVVGGMGSSVSAVGGFLQGGGHGPLSPLYGLAADNAVQIRVVTADGRHVTANSCQNQDLFWALRGGGGGTFGVVTSATYRAYPALQFILSTVFHIQAHSNSSFINIVSEFVDLQVNLSAAGAWSGYTYFRPDLTIRGTFMLPNPNSTTDAIASSSSANNNNPNPFIFLLNHLNHSSGNVNYNSTTDTASSFAQWHASVMCKPTNRDCDNPVGVCSAPASRLIPKAVMQSKDGRNKVAMAISDGLLSGHADEFVGHLVSGGAVERYPPDGNSVNTAWRGALWHGVFTSSWKDSDGQDVWADKKDGLEVAIGPLRELTHRSGCYLNEASANEPDWKDAFFGSHYHRLRSIKRIVDPHDLFSCWHCVGSHNHHH